MGDGYQVIDILLFAGIAAFLVFRLRSVLGRRTGLERRRDPFAPPAPPPANAPTAMPGPRLPRLGVVNGGPAPPAVAAGPAGAVKNADPSFDAQGFLQGARGAFEIIVKAFAAGDKAALQPLLSKDVFARFAEAIDKRVAAKETLETTLAAIKSAEITESSVEGQMALVTVKFVSDQTNVTRGADAAIVDGDPQHAAEHVDSWTFARPVRAPDPNWTLVATHSP
jgi:predicted lipid-binding transport protein (Tim44 family)